MARETSFRVVLVDDHEVVASALSAVVDGIPGAEFVGIVDTVGELFDRFETVDLVVLDLRLADGSSPINNIARIRESGAQVLAFTSGESPYLVRLAASSDVLGVLRKSEPISVLADAILRASRGEEIVSMEWAAALQSDPAIRSAQLSPQEQRVLSLFANGAKASVVATRLGISGGTVDDYVRRIRAKYAQQRRPAVTKVDLYKRALEDGILPFPSSSD